MLSIENYLLENQDELTADDNYIGFGAMAVSKKFLQIKVLKQYKTVEKNILQNIPFEKGDAFVLPTKVELLSRGSMAFAYDDIYSFGYGFIQMFESDFDWLHYSIVWGGCIGNFAPVLKVFCFDDFVGVISPIKRRND